jgi:hypothetical protein
MFEMTKPAIGEAIMIILVAGAAGVALEAPTIYYMAGLVAS